MRFPPVEDISGLETRRFSINTLDRQMHELVRDVRFAVTHSRHLIKRSRELASSLDDLLLQHEYTHRSMRLLLKVAYRESEYVIVADTASLAREQVEKIYQAVILCQGPRKWMRQYLRSRWQKDYERYLLEIDEYSGIKRFRNHLYNRYPPFLEGMRRNKLRRKEIRLVSDFAIRVIEYDWHTRKATKPTPKPVWFNRKGSIRSFLRAYFYFPTPWDVMTKTRKRTLYVFLDRWYREYKSLSEYSHVLMGKVIAQRANRDKSFKASQRAAVYGQKEAGAFILMSHIAIASLCTIIMSHLGNDYGTKRTTREYWNELNKRSLLAKAFWKLYAEETLTD